MLSAQHSMERFTEKYVLSICVTIAPPEPNNPTRPRPGLIPWPRQTTKRPLTMEPATYQEALPVGRCPNSMIAFTRPTGIPQSIPACLKSSRMAESRTSSLVDSAIALKAPAVRRTPTSPVCPKPTSFNKWPISKAGPAEALCRSAHP